MRSTCKTTIVLTALVVAGIAGCGKGADPHGRLPLAGTVTFNGKPLEAGTIEFLPADPKQLSARTLVTGGKFQIARQQGLPAGTYRVLICSPQPSQTEVAAGPPGMKMPPPGQERIPPQFNRDSKKTIDVKADGDNTYHFTIP
jgi:hypothetical protein